MLFRRLLANVYQADEEDEEAYGGPDDLDDSGLPFTASGDAG